MYGACGERLWWECVSLPGDEPSPSMGVREGGEQAEVDEDGGDHEPFGDGEERLTVAAAAMWPAVVCHGPEDSTVGGLQRRKAGSTAARGDPVRAPPARRT